MTSKPQNLFTFLFGITLILTTTPALADEIWITTEASGKGAGKKVGNWAVSDDGDTRFTFAVPDNMKTFVAAKVVVIGKKDKDILYDLSLSISQNGQRHDDFTDDTFKELPALVFKDELLEIDVSLPFERIIEFFPGEDYIALHFKADKKRDVRVLGLRFQYEAAGPAGATLSIYQAAKVDYLVVSNAGSRILLRATATCNDTNDLALNIFKQLVIRTGLRVLATTRIQRGSSFSQDTVNTLTSLVQLETHENPSVGTDFGDLVINCVSVP